MLTEAEELELLELEELELKSGQQQSVAPIQQPVQPAQQAPVQQPPSWGQVAGETILRQIPSNVFGAPGDILNLADKGLSFIRGDKVAGCFLCMQACGGSLSFLIQSLLVHVYSPLGRLERLTQRGIFA